MDCGRCGCFTVFVGFNMFSVRQPEVLQPSRGSWVLHLQGLHAARGIAALRSLRAVPPSCVHAYSPPPHTHYLNSLLIPLRSPPGVQYPSSPPTQHCSGCQEQVRCAHRRLTQASGAGVWRALTAGCRGGISAPPREGDEGLGGGASVGVPSQPAAGGHQRTAQRRCVKTRAQWGVGHHRGAAA